jgi:DNA-binding ferritin-like protein
MAGESTALVGALRELLGNVYGMYFRAHSAHWNVEGPFFGPLHDFFGELYEAVFDSADLVAEIMRFHRYYAPNSKWRPQASACGLAPSQYCRPRLAAQGQRCSGCGG